MSTTQMTSYDGIGLALGEAVRRQLGAEPEWACEFERGFGWWPGSLRQAVWSEPCFEDDGVQMARVHGATKVLRGFNGVDNDVRNPLPMLARPAAETMIDRDQLINVLRAEYAERNGLTLRWVKEDQL